MSYNSNLQNKNLKLQNILNKINNLPTGGGGTDTSDATATPDLVYQGETFYSANGKETGTMSLDTEIASQNELLTQIETALATKASGGGDYNAGFEAGRLEGEGLFWDAFQLNGEQTTYNYAFAGPAWTAESFKPKYDVRPIKAGYIFRDIGFVGDLAAHLENLGVSLDMSRCIDLTQAFRGMRNTTRLPIINMTGVTTSKPSLNYLFCECSNLVTIDKIILPTSGSSTFLNTFMNTPKLEEIKFEGTISDSIDVSPCASLSKESIKNIISCMSTTVSGKTLTLKRTAVNKAFETSTGANDGSSSAEWNLLINGDGTNTNPGRTNWTINLV